MVDGKEGRPETLAAFRDLLRDAGVLPRAELRGPDGLPAIGVNARWLHHGETLILALQRAKPWEAPGQIEVQLAAPMAIEDMRAPGSVRHTQQFTVTLDPITPTILSLRHR